MNKNLRNALLVMGSVVMILLSVMLGSGKANEVNKSEVLYANASSTGAGGVSASTSFDVSEDMASLTDANIVVTDEYMEELDTESETTEATETQDTAMSEVDKILADMSVEDKVAQLFIVTPEALTDNTGVTMAGDATRDAIDKTPVGGIIYMTDNLQSETQVKEMLGNTEQYSRDRIGLPAFLAVDEEGGVVARIAGSGRFGVTSVGNMSDIGANGTVEDARNAGATIGSYMKKLGFNVDFAPVADVLTNSENSVVKYRSFGSDLDKVSDMSVAVMEGLKSEGIESTFKHFPGHGSTAGDTHVGAVFTTKTLAELKESDLIPFQNAIDNGANFIMVSHVSVPNITGHDTPASLSEKMINEVLRGDMGYNGIVVTDAMDMGAITSKYSSGEAAVMAIQAGADIVLMPEDFHQAYDGVLEAVNSGEISEERLNESLRRIISIKLDM